jgi:hypothetical protein
MRARSGAEGSGQKGSRGGRPSDDGGDPPEGGGGGILNKIFKR